MLSNTLPIIGWGDECQKLLKTVDYCYMQANIYATLGKDLKLLCVGGGKYHMSTTAITEII